MQTLWTPSPAFALFRRIVNVFSSLSIGQHYLSQKAPPLPAEASERKHTDASHNLFRPFGWLGWLSKQQATLSVAVESHPQMHEPLRDPPRPPPTHPHRTSRKKPMDLMHRLLHNPTLYDPIRAPRNPVVLCHGLYGFDVRGPAAFPMLRHHYWSNALAILRQKIGAEVIVTSVPGTGSVVSRAKTLHEMLCGRATGRSINLVAHSMGGLDCRHLITHIRPTEYQPLSLTTIATPHRGSPFMDWCTENIGIGKLRQKEHEMEDLVREITGRPHKQDPPNRKESEDFKGFTLSLSSLPSSFTTLLLSLLDSPAYANLSTSYLTNIFNPHTPDDPRVRYFSVAGRISSMNIWHPLWLPKLVLDGYEARERERLGEHWEPQDGGEAWGNDGLVTVQSARWGEFLGIMEECDHWELRGARGIELDLWPSSGDDASGGTGEGWGLGDWGRFVGAWKREEKHAREAGAATSDRLEQERGSGYRRDLTKAQTEETAGGAAAQRANDGEKDQGFVDDVVKASTDKLSAVFDWIVDQVPSGSRSASGTEAAAKAEARQEAKKVAERSDLATKADLERFYVALCRKLYDEGL